VPLFGLMQVWVRSQRVDLGYELTGGMNLAPALTERTRLR
jgi:peptide/nickel transport system substrate-binding protein